MIHRRSFWVLILFGVMLVSSVSGQSRVPITWFVGLGTGTSAEQLAMQEAVVERFNASQDEIELRLQVADNTVAADTLRTLIASGQAPDVVGPVGLAGANAFAGEYLNLLPLIESSGYEISQFQRPLVDAQFDENAGLVGLPFASFPSVLFYNKRLFDNARLAYPPARFGDDYVDGAGNRYPWNIETMTAVARLLTLDDQGRNVNDPAFDESNIVQYGFTNQWINARGRATLFGAGSLVDGAGDAMMPSVWRDAFVWEYLGIWRDQFIPSQEAFDGDLLQGNGFASGHVAMANTHLWYSCCVEHTDWDLAPIPSYQGETTAALHVDSFRILKDTSHPAEAFAVIDYLTGESALDLLSVYGGMPARTEDQARFFAALDERYPQGVNWDLVVAAQSYLDLPSHEAFLPDFVRANDHLLAFQERYLSTPGLDMDAEIDRLVADLQALFDLARE